MHIASDRRTCKLLKMQGECTLEHCLIFVFDQRLATSDWRLFAVNVVNVDERYQSVTFITYLHESKELVNVVNVAQRFFALNVC